jgi:hypothetical protein
MQRELVCQMKKPRAIGLDWGDETGCPVKAGRGPKRKLALSLFCHR